MFQETRNQHRLSSLWAIGALALLSLLALLLTAWILADFSREEFLLKQLTRHLPASDLENARELAGDLRLQWRLSVILILNLVALGVTLSLMVRAYLSSQRSLRDVKVLATDILASIDQAIITTDRNGVILSLNPLARELLQRQDDGIGIALSELGEQHAALQEICHRVLTNQDHVRDQDYTAAKNGHERNLRVGCSRLRDHSQRQLGTVIHVSDVTEKTLMEQRLLRMERYMGLGSLAAGLQHEIKNPLSALSLHVQLLDETLQQECATPAVHEMLDVLKAETRRITGVLEGFRDFASIAELNRTSVNIRALVEKLLRLVDPEAKQKGVSIKAELPEDIAPAWIDAGRIEQVLLNLVLNAMAAMPNGGLLEIAVVDTPNTLQVDVRDTGTGIPEDLRKRIFDPYFTTRSTGTGMGLALSEKIIRQHNGSIDFRSGPDGTVFTITLPRHEST